jgi:hypothetical protein
MLPGNSRSPYDIPSPNDRELQLTNLVKGYLLGDYLQDCNYKDTLADALMQWGSEYTSATLKPFNQAPLVYASTNKDSPLRELIVDLTLWIQDSADWNRVRDDQLPNAFLCDYIRAREARNRCSRVMTVAARNTAPFIRFKGTCHYHCHGEDGCYKKKPER